MGVYVPIYFISLIFLGSVIFSDYRMLIYKLSPTEITKFQMYETFQYSWNSAHGSICI